MLNEHVLGGGGGGIVEHVPGWGGGGIGLNDHVLGGIIEFVPGGRINFTCLGG